MEREDGTPLIALDNQIQDEALLPEYIKIEKENKWGPRMSMVNPDQDEAVALLIQIQEERDLDLESEPSGVEKIIETCCELDNQFNLISEAYHLLYGGPNNLLHESSHQTEIETPMKISVLHIAAWNGNDDIVARLIKRAPKLLSENNKNNDSVLHVAARGGNISTVKILLEGYTRFQIQQLKTKSNSSRQSKDDFEQCIREELLTFVKRGNNQGNTMFHEVMLCDKSKIGGNMIFNVCEFFQTKDQNQNQMSSSNSCYDYTIDIVNHAKKTVLYLAVENGKKDAVDLILEKCRKNDLMPKGLSPFVAAIMMHNQEMMRIIQKHKPTWIHSKDKHERLPLHYAASIGYLEGVNFLLELCECCTIQRDKNGYFPIHLASYGGHVEVVKKLLQYCPDPTEMLDTSHERNILHIAANHGKHEVVCYILQSEILKHHKLINQKDNKGDTPLHLAARSCHPTTVYYLLNQKNKRVNIDLVNKNNETALDIVNALYDVEKSSLRQHLTWTALKSAGAKQSLRKVRPHIETKLIGSISQKTEQGKDKNLNQNESQQSEKQSKEKENDSERYKDRIENLTVVSTLILTASVAACLAVPGEADGNANNLNHAMFQFFILFITISLFSSISATIILFWATLGLTELVTFTLKIVMPLLGIALISLSLAFMGGIYTVISKLSWLANVFLVISVIFIIVVVLLYILLFLPSSSTIKPLRYISHYPFLYLASRAERKIDQGLKPWG